MLWGDNNFLSIGDVYTLTICPSSIYNLATVQIIGFSILLCIVYYLSNVRWVSNGYELEGEGHKRGAGNIIHGAVGRGIPVFT